MPKFRVWFTRDVTESCYVDVTADSAEDAPDVARGEAGDGFSNVNFELDEMSCGTTAPYVSDVEVQDALDA